MIYDFWNMYENVHQTVRLQVKDTSVFQRSKWLTDWNNKYYT